MALGNDIPVKCVDTMVLVWGIVVVEVIFKVLDTVEGDELAVVSSGVVVAAKI